MRERERERGHNHNKSEARERETERERERVSERERERERERVSETERERERPQSQQKRTRNVSESVVCTKPRRQQYPQSQPTIERELKLRRTKLVPTDGGYTGTVHLAQRVHKGRVEIANSL